jgi:hypothetical protein
MKGMEVESGLSKFVQCCCSMQSVQPNDDAALQGRGNPRRSTGFEQLLETSVTKAVDHAARL